MLDHSVCARVEIGVCRGTTLEGLIPEDIGQCIKLEKVYLGLSRFSGNLPCDAFLKLLQEGCLQTLHVLEQEGAGFSNRQEVHQLDQTLQARGKNFFYTPRGEQE